MPYTPIDDTNSDWPTYSQQRGRFAGAADAVSRSQPKTPEAPIRAEQPQPVRFWQIGDLVTITHPEDKGVKALVYEVYDWRNHDYGISLIAEDGRNLGGWESSTWKFLEFDHETALIYDFVSVGQLAYNYQTGLFKPYFEIFS